MGISVLAPATLDIPSSPREMEGSEYHSNPAKREILGSLTS